MTELCDKCGINAAFYKIGGVLTCAVCAKEELKDDPVFIRHQQRIYQPRPKQP